MKVSSGTVMTVVGACFAILIMLLIFGIVYIEYLKSQNQDSTYFIGIMSVIGFVVASSLLVFILKVDPEKQSTDKRNDK